jgi:hypothetical protein
MSDNIYTESPLHIKTSSSDPVDLSSLARDWAVVDPLFFGGLDLGDVSTSELHDTTLGSSVTVNAKALHRVVDGNQFGYVRYFERRLQKGTSTDSLGQLVFPIYITGVWSVAVLIGLRTSTPRVLFYSPVEVLKTGGSSTSSDQNESPLCKTARHLLSLVLQRARKGTVGEGADAVPLLPLVHIVATGSTSSHEDSGLAVILFLKALKSVLPKVIQTLSCFVLCGHVIMCTC